MRDPVGLAALAVLGFVAAVVGGMFLLTLLPLLGLVWGVLDWAWLIGVPLAWWWSSGRARRAAAPVARRRP